MTDQPATKQTAGRPSLYSEEIGDLICTRIMDGFSIKDICEDDGMPAARTVYLWALRNTEFSKKYTEARRIQRDVMADDIIEIADGEMSFVDPDVARAKIAQRQQRINSRQWTLTKLDDRFRERVAHTGPNGGPIQVDDVSLTDTERATKLAAFFDTVRARNAGKADGDPEDMGTSAGAADPSI